MPKKIRLISKYAGRKYFDRANSKFITTPEIYAAYQKGDNILVYEPKSGMDVTETIIARVRLKSNLPCLLSMPDKVMMKIIDKFGGIDKCIKELTDKK